MADRSLIPCLTNNSINRQPPLSSSGMCVSKDRCVEEVVYLRCQLTSECVLQLNCRYHAQHVGSSGADVNLVDRAAYHDTTSLLAAV